MDYQQLIKEHYKVLKTQQRDLQTRFDNLYEIDKKQYLDSFKVNSEGFSMLLLAAAIFIILLFFPKTLHVNLA